MESKMESERIEEYLEAIYKKQGTEMPVSTSTLAEELKVSLPAVTDMLQKLEKKGLIEYRANKGASLTEQGKRVAVLTVRRHRLWERFLTDILGLRWDKVHDEACRLEHATSPDTEKGLVSILGDVETCPHGHYIPDEEGNIKEEQATPLSEFEPGQKAYILAIAKEEPSLLRESEKMGLKPKTVVSLESKNIDGTLELKLNGERLLLKKDLATALMARPLRSEDETTAMEEITLSKLARGESGTLKSFAGGRGMLGRCLSMGFTPGSLVEMLENFGSGPVLVKIHDTEVALGRGLAQKMIVTRSKAKC
jgi:DtxR family Mn-dependent transcriptional regulator